MTETLAGWAVLGIPLLIIGLAPLGRSKAVAAFYIVLLIVGLGYLAMTGALQDIGRKSISVANEYMQGTGQAAAPADKPRERPANPVATVPDPAPQTP